ncbi:phage tail terminator-like protein [Stenotrophomonas sp. 364]|uniref:phage tail terminator-like protein n=1 Tax=Stenotrophomonas sp. 364 TaxID=2691571 RepID=UPI001F31DEEB|nr:phage tail terminator-like protein [Stenotrophomonas sp. 364]
MRRAIKAATRSEQAYQDAARALGCVVCRWRFAAGLQRGIGCGRVRIHHRNVGDLHGQKQIGQHAVVAMGDWHHQGIPLPGKNERAMYALFGPSFQACSYPGQGFTPPTGNGARWLELQWFPNRTENYGIEDDGPFLMQGFGQLSACYRPGQGIMVGTAITDQIIAAFAKGTTFAGMRVERKPWTSRIIQDPERVMHPVTIPWRGFCS